MRIGALDFSASKAKWARGCRNSNVWLATATLDDSGSLFLNELLRPQSIPGSGTPFQNLAKILKTGEFEAVGIDAPLSVPIEFLPEGKHQRLVETIVNLGDGESDFPSGKLLIEKLVSAEHLPYGIKKFRKTEELWRRKVSTRSALWAGPRGGTGLLSAAIILMHQTNRQLWPLHQRENLLLEVFPAAQLHQWGLPTVRYDGSDTTARKNREIICNGIAAKISGLDTWREILLDSGDALDAVVGLFGVAAMLTGKLVSESERDYLEEGWIGVAKG